jgi:two-component system chemotaxis response regulator CheY
MRGLIVDDAVFMRAVIRRILEEIGFTELAEAGNGTEAIQVYSSFKPDVVTMDITMPEMDGLTALKKILEIDPKAKIIVFSAMGQEGIVREAIKGGAKHFIVKPFEKEKVIATINTVLNA